MKKIFSFIIFTNLFSCVNAQEKFTPEQKSIQKVIINMFQSLSDRDIGKLKEKLRTWYYVIRKRDSLEYR